MKTADMTAAEFDADIEKMIDGYGLSGAFQRSVFKKFCATQEVLTDIAREYYAKLDALKQEGDRDPVSTVRYRMRARLAEREEARAELFACSVIMELVAEDGTKIEPLLDQATTIAYSDIDQRQVDRELEGNMRRFFRKSHTALINSDGLTGELHDPTVPRTEFSRRQFVGKLGHLGAAMALGGAAGTATQAALTRDHKPDARALAGGLSAGFVIQMVREMTPDHAITQPEFKAIMKGLRGLYMEFCDADLNENRTAALATQKQLMGHMSELSVVLHDVTPTWDTYTRADRPEQQAQNAHTWLRDQLLNAVTPMTYLDASQNLPLRQSAKLAKQIADRLTHSPAEIDTLSERLVPERSGLDDAAFIKARSLLDAIRIDVGALGQQLSQLSDRATTMHERGFGPRID